jgi:hypothetical protein
MTRRTSAKSLRRKTEIRPELRTIVVFCEGEASEPDYVNGLKALPHVRASTSIRVEIGLGEAVPLTLVQRAAERLRNAEVDECWAVFDVEWPKHHPNLDRAVDLARANGVRLAISNPCFELWLALHHVDHTACVSTAAAEKASRKLDGRSGKRIDAGAYMGRRAEACTRARALTTRHEKNGTVFPKDNPSSTMYELVEAIERAADRV